MPCCSLIFVLKQHKPTAVQPFTIYQEIAIIETSLSKEKRKITC